MALQGGVVVRFELRPQSPLLLVGGEDARRPARRRPRRQLLTLLLAALEPALGGRQGDAEGAEDLPPGDAAVHRGQNL